ncbi:serine/threonine protein kinase [Roseiconus lacunae]|uniref:serine/threonine protein kinase n=1 Tax=Roseiconus lacunae TaxID=2605694 RepID=UPI001359A970|nr:serine/threonine-protein kinase [Roseiconus lacunae]
MTAATQCPTDENLRRYAIGDYVDDEGDTIEAHLAECETCEETLARFESVDDSLLRHLPLATGGLATSDEPSWLQRLISDPSDDAPPPDRQPLAISGQDFGAYEIRGILGRGGMGVVYAATHRRLGKPVAIKVVSPKLVAAHDARRRFERETKVLGTLNHPGIVSATDAGTIGGAAYLAMEQVDGVNLAKLVQQIGPLRIDEACAVGRQIALALAAAHQAGAVHRDIKPSNVMIDREGKIKLLDFGLAHLSTALTTQTETSLGKLLGTLDYMAPEQASGGEVGPAADLYGLGATVFFLLTGRPPRNNHDNTSLIGQLRRIADDPADSLANHRADAPAELVESLSNLLELEPRKRPKSADHAANWLLKFCDENTDQRLKEIAAGLPPILLDQTPAEIDRSLSLLLGNEPANRIEVEPIVQPGGGASTWRKLLAITGGVAFLGLLLGLTVLVLQTPEGTVRIESEVSGITLDFVDQENRVTGVEIDEGKHATVLRTGRYIVKFRDPPSGFVVSPNDFRVDQKHDITVRVHRLPQNDIGDAGINAAATEQQRPPILYAGKTKAQWQTNFDTERNPIAKTEAKDQATFIEANPDSLLAMLEDYNAKTRHDRQSKFDPSIKDLTLDQIVDSMQSEAKKYRRRGLHNVADALEASAKQQRFVNGLEYMGGVTGTFYRSREDGELTFKQYLPGVLHKQAGTTAQMVYLSDIELRYSRDGWSSSDWGDLHPVLDGDWKLESVSRYGKQLEGPKLDEWRSNRPWWDSIKIRDNQRLTLTGVNRPNKFWIELSYDDALPKIELKVDASSEDLDQNLYGVFMTNAAVDFTKLTLVIDTDQVDSFRTEGTHATKMQFTRAPDKNMVEPDITPKAEVTQDRAVDPATPRVKIVLQTESGEPATGVTVRLDQTGVKDKQPAWADGTSGSDGIVLDRILPFGYYRMRVETPDGWRTSFKNVAVEFEKGLSSTIIVPDPGQKAELNIEQLPDLGKADRLGELRFGTLRDYLTRNNLRSGAYSPVRTPEPGGASKTFADFPTVANGIEDIAVRLRLEVSRELADPFSSDDTQTVTWKWNTKDVGAHGLFLNNSNVRFCESLASKSTLPVDDNDYFQMPSDIHRLEYLALKLGEAKPYPRRIAIPRGEAKLMLVGIYGRPSEQVIESIKMLPLQEDEQVWLATSLDAPSNWVERIVGEPWFYAKDPGNYYGHLSRIEKTLTDGGTLNATFTSGTNGNP